MFQNHHHFSPGDGQKLQIDLYADCLRRVLMLTNSSSYYFLLALLHTHSHTLYRILCSACNTVNSSHAISVL